LYFCFYFFFNFNFLFEPAKRDNIYKRWNKSLLSTRSAKKSYSQVSQKYQYKRDVSKYSARTLVNTQTKQWVRPPTMIIRSKSNSRRLQPLIREHLDLVQQKRHGACCVVKQTMVSFIPYDPNTGKPNKLQKRPASSKTPSWVCELDKMVSNSVGVYRRKADPRAN
jgi:hypothetical protein